MLAVRRMVPRRAPREAGQRRDRLDLAGAGCCSAAAVLCLLLPLVSVEGGARLPLLLLVGGAAAWWRLRAVGAPDRRRRRRRRCSTWRCCGALPGYATGLAVGALYFTGFTGVFLVLSVYLQDELGCSPLTAGLLLTPFAARLGADRAARRPARLADPPLITVLALAVMMTRRAPRGAAGAGSRRRRPLAVAGAAAAARRASAAAAWSPRTSRSAWPRCPPRMGGRRRRRAADRAADRLLDRRRAADDRLPADARHHRHPGPAAAVRAAHRPRRARRRAGDGGRGRCGTRSGSRGCGTPVDRGFRLSAVCGRQVGTPGRPGIPRGALQDGAGGVRRGLRVPLGDGRDPAYDGLRPGRPRRR